MTRSELKRQAIIKAAMKEFISNGFEAANMNMVCQQAQVSKRTLYRHFESKQLLFEAVLRIEYENNQQPLNYRFDPARSLSDQLSDIVKSEIAYLYSKDGVAYARMIVMEFFREPETAKKLTQDLYHTQAISQWFNQAIDAEAIKPVDLGLLTDIYMSLFNGMFMWPQILKLAPPVAGEELTSRIAAVVEPIISAYAVESEPK